MHCRVRDNQWSREGENRNIPNSIEISIHDLRLCIFAISINNINDNPSAEINWICDLLETGGPVRSATCIVYNYLMLWTVDLSLQLPEQLLEPDSVLHVLLRYVTVIPVQTNF